MALDKLVDSAQLDNDLGTVADGIRYATGDSGMLSFPSGMASAARSLKPTGTKQINANGDHSVAGYALAHVNVPNPSTGTISISENGTYDVTEKASAVVNVSGGGGADLSDLEIYIADFRTDPPTMTEGALNVWHRTLVS